VSQNWLRVISCSIFRSAFSKFLLLFVVCFGVLLLSCSPFLMTNDPFYIFFFRNDWIDVWCCSFKSFSFTVCVLLRDLYYYYYYYYVPLLIIGTQQDANNRNNLNSFMIIFPPPSTIHNSVTETLLNTLKPFICTYWAVTPGKKVNS
jgi:hypothetical protein